MRLGLILSIALLGCGGGDVDEGWQERLAPEPSEVLERQIELGEAFVLEIEKIDDESDAEAAFPRLVSLAAAIYRATPPGHPWSMAGTSEQMARRETLQVRLVDELIRIGGDNPDAVAIIVDALTAAILAPLE